MMYVLLVIGFLLLIKGADFFVDGSSSIAGILKVPTVVIGLTVVAFGTSLPETAVSVTAAASGENALAISNVIGSNMFNLLVVLGACALIKPIKVKVSLLKKEFPFYLIITVFLLFALSNLAFKNILAGSGEYQLTRVTGLIFLALFILFLFSTVKFALREKSQFREISQENKVKMLSPLKSTIYIVVGISGIALGGNLVVKSASEIATSFGLSQTFIGLTIVALGTSLPELVTSMVAAKKGEEDLAIGNVVGSNIFNVLLVLGLSASISPITVSVEAIYDIGLLTVASVLTYIFAVSKRGISRIEGFFLIILYLIFFAYILVR